MGVSAFIGRFGRSRADIPLGWSCRLRAHRRAFHDVGDPKEQGL